MSAAAKSRRRRRRRRRPLGAQAAGPLIIIGTTLVGIAGIKADWPGFWAALTVVTGGMVALFVGPSGAWLAAGIGIFIAIVGFAVARAKLRVRKDIAWAPTPSTQ